MAFSLLKIKARVAELARLQYSAVRPLGPILAHPIQNFDENETQLVLREGERWGKRDTLYQLDFEVEIPTDWRGQTVALHLDISQTVNEFVINTVEGLIFINGKAFHALDRYHREIILTPELAARPKLEVTIHLWTGINEDYHTVGQLELRRIDEAAYELHSQLALTVDAIENLPPTSPSYYALAAALDETVAALDFRRTDENTFFASCGTALEILKTSLQALNAQFPASANGPTLQPHVTAIGHAHIDVAWLWQLWHTRIKAANTFSTALYHMERYPYFTFIQSQPQLYQFVKEDQPELYARIKQKVADGQWEPEGAMWVEADTNITGAESLVRQFLFGQRFFQREFGYRCKVLWLPDVFGYSAALPQIIKAAGADYFITSKISWNDTNRLPNDTFWWQGLDGTRVLTYFLTAQNDDVWPAYTYNGEMRPGVLARSWKNYRQKDANRETLVAYGWGDGGGGPTRAMVEAAGAMSQPLSRELPTASTGRVADFMTRLEAQVQANPALPRWVGELYLEYHRGTYTSQSRDKRNNRLAERDLHNAEWLASAAQTLTGQTYPQARLNKAWEIVLTHQFHDILPGSSIGPVYADAEQNYATVRETTNQVSHAAYTELVSQIDAPAHSLVVFNGLSWERREVVELDGEVAAKLNLPSQPLENNRVLAEVNAVPAFGYQTYTPQNALAQNLAASMQATNGSLESDFYRLELNERGQLTRLWDKTAGREVLAAGARANVFQLFEDKPIQYDAWDIDFYYEQKSWELDQLVSCRVIEQGPLRAGLQLEWQYNGRTRVSQKLYIYAHSRRIDFVTKVDWQERQTLLKVAFPVEIHNGVATADIQFGNIERPTHRNTSWDQARFETCAHKWFDLSEGAYGVAILNDCKYGYDVHDNVMRQTLLKGAIYPDPQADLGQHIFTYSLFPHAGGWFEGDVHRAAYELNQPLLTVVKTAKDANESLAASWGLVQIEPSDSSVIIETVKRAEDSDDLIVRLYECANRRGPVKIRLPFAVAQVAEVNLLEEEIAISEVTLASDKMSFQVNFLPYQIKSFKLRVA